MIKPNELRIGNILRDSVSMTFLEVIGLDKENITTYVLDRKMFPLTKGWKLEPVILNEYLVEKTGFEFKEVNNENEFEYRNVYRKKITNSDNYFEVHFVTDSYDKHRIFNYIEFNNGSFEYINLKETQYFHNLQNAWFFQTHQELKFN